MTPKSKMNILHFARSHGNMPKCVGFGKKKKKKEEESVTGRARERFVIIVRPNASKSKQNMLSVLTLRECLDPGT